MSPRASRVVAESPLSSSAKKLRRWDSDDFAERKIKDKLGGFDKFEVENAVGKTSALNVKEYILRHYRNNKESKGNLAITFFGLPFSPNSTSPATASPICAAQMTLLQKRRPTTPV